MAERNNTGMVLLAFLVGGAVGAGIALLFAPASGAETRRRLRETAEELRDRTDEFVEESRERITDLVSDGKDRIEDFVEQGREGLSTISSKIGSLVEEGRRAYRQRREELSQTEENLPQAAPSDEGIA